ncbi:MAG TPA: MBL fold metallo-hydrolase [Trebonia sp.]
MRLTVVGCAGSFPGPDSAASCYLLEADGFRLVIDLGNGALGALQRHAGLFDIDAVCLSHLHADHCVDLYSYSIARTYAPAGPQPPLPVYGPAGTRERIGLIHGAGGDGGLMDRFAFETLAPGSLSIGPFDVTTVRVNHPVETFGFRFSHGGRTIAYTGDTGETEEVPLLARDCDVFLSEAAFLDGPDLPPNLHLSAGQAAGYALRAGVGKLVLTHLQPWNDADKALAEAAAVFDGALTVAAPGQLIAP